MRSNILIRCGIASLLIGGGVGGLFAAGCGSDDNGATGNNNDSGTDGSNQVGDDAANPGDDSGSTGHVDGGGGTDADAAPPPPVHGKLILVNASASPLAFNPTGSLRFCFGFAHGTDGGDAGTVTVSKTPPAPNTLQGVPQGTGGPAADTATDIASQNIVIYGINSAALATQTPDAGSAELNCSDLIGDNALAADAGGLGLVEGQSYWNLGTLPAGTIADGTTTLVAVTGCGPGNTTTALDSCPLGYAADVATGDLGLSVAKLDTTTQADGGVGAQFAYASTPFSTASTLYGGAAVAAGFFTTTFVTPDAGISDAAVSDAADAAPVDAGAPQPVPVNTFIPIAAPVENGQLAPPTLAVVPGLTFDSLSGFAVSAITADGGPTVLNPGFPFPFIQAVSAPNADAGIFGNGNGYVFVLVGDPRLSSFIGADGGPLGVDAGGAFNVLSAHVLGFPVNPPFGN
jgi:hypothetical protein